MAEWKGTEGNPIEVSADDIMDAIAEGEYIKVEYAVIKGDLDISQLNIPGSLSISDSTFSGQVFFVGVSFSKKVKICNVNFNEKVSFFKATFNKEVCFISYLPLERRTTFRRKADFRYTTFSDNADFSYAIFKGDVSFNEATFSGKVDFDSVIFSEEGDFNYTTFIREVSFLSARFSKSANFLYAKMNYPANFAGVKSRENIVIAGLWNNILQPLFSILTFGKVKFPQKTITDFSKFNTGTIMDGSSNPYLKRYIDDEQWIKSWRSSSWWRNFLFIVWELTSHCGRSIGLWAFWSLIIAVLFGLAYAHIIPLPDNWQPNFKISDTKQSDSIDIQEEDIRKPTWFTYIYFSVVTFTTLGFGDVTPLNTAGEILLTIEVILGYVMLGGLISIFANKLARRS